MNDTHPSIERKRIELLRQLGPEGRLMLTLRFSKNVIELSREQFVRRHGTMGLQRWLEAHYGSELAGRALQARRRAP